MAARPSPDPAAVPSRLLGVDRQDGGVAVVTFESAESMNAFDAATLRQIRFTLEELLQDASVRAIVLTGSDGVFCAGADINEFKASIEAGTVTSFVLAATEELHALLLALWRSDTVFVAAINGAAAGGGLGLALVADYRVASPGARLAASYFRLGLCPDGGATWLLPRLIGTQRSRRFFFDNEVMGAEEALATGAVDEVTEADHLLERAIAVAAHWGSWSKASRGSTKRLLSMQAGDFAAQLDAEQGLITASAAAPDFAEGVAAFLEKREPNFA